MKTLTTNLLMKIFVVSLAAFIITSSAYPTVHANDLGSEISTLAPESMMKKIKADIEPEMETARDFKLDVVSTRIIPGGLGTFSKPIVVVNTPEGEFVIKRINALDDNDVAFPVDYPQFLKRELSDLNIPAISKKGTSGTKPEDFYTKIYNKKTGKTEYYQVEHWAAGKTLSRYMATDMPDTLRATGRLLGAIHARSRYYKEPYDRHPGYYTLAAAADIIKAPNAKWRKNLQGYLDTDELNTIDTVVDEIRTFWTTQRFSELPLQPITSDLNFGNMFFNDAGDKVIGAIDWDQVRKGYWHEDFFSTLVHTGRVGEGLYVGPLRKDLEIFMEGYREGYGEDFPEKDLLLLPAFFTVQPMVHIAYAANNLSGNKDKDVSTAKSIKKVIKVLRDVRKELGTIKDVETILALEDEIKIPLTAKAIGPTANDGIKNKALIRAEKAALKDPANNVTRIIRWSPIFVDLARLYPAFDQINFLKVERPSYYEPDIISHNNRHFDLGNTIASAHIVTDENGDITLDKEGKPYIAIPTWLYRNAIVNNDPKSIQQLRLALIKDTVMASALMRMGYNFADPNLKDKENGERARENIRKAANLEGLMAEANHSYDRILGDLSFYNDSILFKMAGMDETDMAKVFVKSNPRADIELKKFGIELAERVRNYIPDLLVRRLYNKRKNWQERLQKYPQMPIRPISMYLKAYGKIKNADRSMEELRKRVNRLLKINEIEKATKKGSVVDLKERKMTVCNADTPDRVEVLSSDISALIGSTPHVDGYKFNTKDLDRLYDQSTQVIRELLLGKALYDADRSFDALLIEFRNNPTLEEAVLAKMQVFVSNIKNIVDYDVVDGIATNYVIKTVNAKKIISYLLKKGVNVSIYSTDNFIDNTQLPKILKRSLGIIKQDLPNNDNFHLIQTTPDLEGMFETIRMSPSRVSWAAFKGDNTDIIKNLGYNFVIGNEGVTFDQIISLLSSPTLDKKNAIRILKKSGATEAEAEKMLSTVNSGLLTPPPSLTKNILDQFYANPRSFEVSA